MSGSSDDDRSAAVPSTSKGINTTVCFDVVNRPPTGAPNENILQNHLNIALFNVSCCCTKVQAKVSTQLCALM